jgi:hypothetical protein
VAPRHLNPIEIGSWFGNRRSRIAAGVSSQAKQPLRTVPSREVAQSAVGSAPTCVLLAQSSKRQIEAPMRTRKTKRNLKESHRIPGHRAAIPTNDVFNVAPSPLLSAFAVSAVATNATANKQTTEYIVINPIGA